MKTRDRLDKVMVEKGLVKSRDRAKALIMAGNVLVDGQPASKAGMMVTHEVSIALKEEDMPYVSRGGLKLEAALDFFGIDPAGKIVMDVGCSTGGFTDCVLQRSARKVYAVDVGYGQIDWGLRQNPKVILLEKTNIRYLGKESIPEPVDLVVIDVSFISLTKVLPNIPGFLGENSDVLALIKPQFEVGRDMVEKGGVIRDDAKRHAVVEKISAFSGEAGFAVLGVFESPVPGQKGNKEYFMHLRGKVRGRV
jgi:23S rRNA (cytidine1920-2'-O)/16S rRNA (cytidine1409-2'-O)-methyltransferase